MAVKVSPLVERANELMKQAGAIEKRIAKGEDVPDADLEAMESAVSEAAGLYDRGNRARGVSERYRAIEEEAARPPRRRSSPWVADRDDPFAGLCDPTDALTRSMIETHDIDGQPYGPHDDPRNNRGGRHRYSVLRAYQGAVALKDGGTFGGLEGEVHQHLRSRRRERITRGVLIPWNAPVSRELFPSDWRFRDLTTTTGSGAIQTLVQPTMIELLRAKLVLVGLGARLMPGLWSSIDIPRQSSASTAQWVAEGVAGTPSSATIDQVELSPRTVTANTKLTRRFINQSVVDAEDFAVDDLTATVAQALERAAINGSGVGAEPLGLLQNNDVPTLSAIGANGGPLTWTKLLEFIGKHGQANAPLDRRAFLINPITKAKLGGTPREAGFPKYLFDFDDPVSPIAGFPYAESTNMPSTLAKGASGNVLSAVLFGSWSELIIALFSGVDIVVDPYTESTAGNVRISVFQDADVDVRHPQSFVKCSEVSTAA